MKNTCKNCKFFNYKTDDDKGNCYGECLNPKVDTYVSIRGDIGKHVKGDTLDERVDNFISAENIHSKHSRIYFNEETFGCIHFEKDK
ncbi:hypothetical protein COB55_04470 [Candidatus Wolfebacteria bacterium]|nr:MAG: hypothetical protein COB55_04470 [Candidatus Wolfebacteria bacterium]